MAGLNPLVVLLLTFADYRAILDSQSVVESGDNTPAPPSAATAAAATAANVPSEGDESGEEQISPGQEQPDNSGAMGWLGRAAWWVARTAMRRR